MYNHAKAARIQTILAAVPAYATPAYATPAMAPTPDGGVPTSAGNGLAAAFIRANGANLAGSATLGPSFASFSGQILIHQPGTYTYDLFSDDGASLTIGGVTLIDMPDPQSWSGESASITFQQAGLYDIQIDMFDIGDYTGIPCCKTPPRSRPPICIRRCLR